VNSRVLVVSVVAGSILPMTRPCGAAVWGAQAWSPTAAERDVGRLGSVGVAAAPWGPDSRRSVALRTGRAGDDLNAGIGVGVVLSVGGWRSPWSTGGVDGLRTVSSSCPVIEGLRGSAWGEGGVASPGLHRVGTAASSRHWISASSGAVWLTAIGLGSTDFIYENVAFGVEVSGADRRRLDDPIRFEGVSGSGEWRPGTSDRSGDSTGGSLAAGAFLSRGGAESRSASAAEDRDAGRAAGRARPGDAQRSAPLDAAAINAAQATIDGASGQHSDSSGPSMPGVARRGLVRLGDAPLTVDPAASIGALEVRWDADAAQVGAPLVIDSGAAGVLHLESLGFGMVTPSAVPGSGLAAIGSLGLAGIARRRRR